MYIRIWKSQILCSKNTFKGQWTEFKKFKAGRLSLKEKSLIKILFRNCYRHKQGTRIIFTCHKGINKVLVIILLFFKIEPLKYQLLYKCLWAVFIAALFAIYNILNTYSVFLVRNVSKSFSTLNMPILVWR